MTAEREMTLAEWVGRLPEFHLAHRQYTEMRDNTDKLADEIVRLRGEVSKWQGLAEAGVTLAENQQRREQRAAAREAIAPAEAKGEVCSCPSGDGSLRWPCKAHPPATPPAAQVQPVSQRVRDMLEERRNRLVNSFGGTPYEDGRVQQQIDAIDAQLAACGAAQVQIPQELAMAASGIRSNGMYVKGWNDCREAMLATNPAAGDKVRELVDVQFDAIDNADYMDCCASVLEEAGHRIMAEALRVIAKETRTVAAQPQEADRG